MTKVTLSTAVIAGLMGCTALTAGAASSQAGVSVDAKSSWAVSRVASISQGSYCTMAQKYSNNTILSFARNMSGEYSLAIDFQAPNFKNGDSEESVTLQPSGGKKQTLKASPQSQQVIVLGLGRDEALMKQIEKGKSVTITTSSGDVTYNVERFKDGRAEMATCLSALSTQSKPAAEPEAETKLSDSTKADADKASKIAPAASDTNGGVSVEGLLAARPMPSMGAEPISSTQTSVPVGKVEKDVQVAAPSEKELASAASGDSSNNRELQDLRVENAQLKRTLSDARKVYENQQSGAQGAAVSELKEKLASAQDENKDLKDRVAQLEQSTAQKTADNEKSANASKENLANNQIEIQRMTQQVDTLKAENATLRNQIEIASSAAASGTSAPADKAMSAQVASLQQENNALKADIQNLQTQLADKGAKGTSSSKSDSSKDVADLKAKLASTMAENQDLRAQLASSVTAAAGGADDSSVRKEVRTLRSQLETLEAEKKTLQSNFDKLQKDSEGGQLKVAGGNWDLEQATRRYQESQREIRRLGALLEDERLKCTAEKKEIEAMLFDPAISSGAQIAKLNSLEDSLAERETKIKSLEDQLSKATLAAQANPQNDKQVDELKSALAKTEQRLNDAVTKAKTAEAGAGDKDARIATLEGQLAAANADASNKAAAKSADADKVKAENAAIKAQLDEKLSRIAALETQVQSANADAMNKAAAKSAAEDTLKAQNATMKAQIDENLARMATLEGQLASANADAATKSSATAELTVLKAQLAEKESRLAQLQSRMEMAEATTKQLQAEKAAAVSSDALVDTLQTDLKKKATDLGTAQAQLAQAQAQLLQVQAQLQSQSSGQSQQSATIAALQASVQQGQQRIQYLEGQVRTLQAQPASVQQTSAKQASYIQPSNGVESVSYSANADAMAAAKAPVAPIAAAVSFPSSSDYTSFLKTAGVPVKGSVSEVGGGDKTAYRAYSWKTDSLYGSVEMRKSDNAAMFDTIVGQYLARAKSRCKGEFAAVPSSVTARGSEKSNSYEIACVGTDNSSSASVLFAYADGLVTTVAHEGRAEAMDLAIDARDKVAQSFK